MVGTTISHYKVLEKIGEGGMGVVYRATDTKLNRDVALKILPKQFASDSQRMGRFQREAEVLASLDHPNIGQIYGIEEAGATKALVLQLIEGPTLAEKIAQGPIPVEEALKIALQIAEGLEAAHEKGVIHRDLKPANIKITPEGQVKILDFGLAKALEGETPPDTNLSQSPTLTAAGTQAGVILGTAAYMSPEQARGEATDKKADVWAFGCVLFEMLTRQATFGGKTVSDVLAGVLRIDPEWKSLPPNLHPRIRLLLERSLEKESKDRYQGIADARVDIQKALADPSGVLVQPTGDVAQAAPQSKLPWVATIVLATLVAIIATWILKPTELGLVTHFTHGLPEGQVFTNTTRSLVAVSPDGRKVVYVANQQLYLRNLDEMEARPIQGTDESPGHPFFSPDGEWVGYYSRSASQLKKIAIIGGAPVTLCDITSQGPFGASWGSDNTIVYGQSEGIWRVSGNSGASELLIPTEEGEQVHGPQILPGGKAVLFTLSTGNDFDQAQVVVQQLETGERKVVWEGGSDARYVPTGHLVYAVEDVLFALAFDVGNLEVLGGPVPVIEGLRRGGNVFGASANYGFSAQGTLVYVPGSIVSSSILALADRNGSAEPLDVPPNNYLNPRLSPDGNRLVVQTTDNEGSDIWVYDLSGDTQIRQLTLGGNNTFPIWTPDGQRVTFTSDRDGKSDIYWQPADGSGVAGRLATAEEGTEQLVGSWSPDGETLALAVGYAGVGIGVWTLSHDGKTTTPEVFADEPNSFQLGPIFSPDGKELFYLRGQQLLGIDIATDPAFSFGNEQALGIRGFLTSEITTRPYDITPDGQRFLMVFPADQAGSVAETTDEQINIVLNWFEELKARVPVP